MTSNQGTEGFSSMTCDKWGERRPNPAPERTCPMNFLHALRGFSRLQAGTGDLGADTSGQENPFARIVIDLGLTRALVRLGGAIVLPGLGDAIDFLRLDSL